MTRPKALCILLLRNEGNSYIDRRQLLDCMFNSLSMNLPEQGFEAMTENHLFVMWAPC